MDFLRINKKQQNSNVTEWKKSCYFNDVHYTRNLIYSTDKFELMILCWKTAQYSRIHDHQNSHCWMMVLDGPMKEQVFRITDADGPQPNPDGEEESCPNLEKIRETKYPSGEVAYINDRLGLHSFGNADCEFSTVSMHIYAPPIRRVKIFEPTEGRVIERTPGFYSVGSVREISE